jgi:hypothetical protein
MYECGTTGQIVIKFGIEGFDENIPWKVQIVQKYWNLYLETKDVLTCRRHKFAIKALLYNAKCFCIVDSDRIDR